MFFGCGGGAGHCTALDRADLRGKLDYATITMKRAPAIVLLCSIFMLSAVFGGCVSPERYAEQRRQRLLVLYPPGKTTRADVRERWGIQPEPSETRPVSGWTASTHPAIGKRASASEQRTGQSVYRCERYFGPDGWSGGLCYCWLYYDDRDYIVDAEWQWHTD